MEVKVFDDRLSLSGAAADQAAASLRRVIAEQGSVRIIAATGASQIDFLDELTRASGIDWERVEVFHLDEYIGVPITHPASFRKYLRERLIQKTGIRKYHFLDGDSNFSESVKNVGAALTTAPIDIAFLGIGENGHLAFNDPPADFTTEEPYLIVTLDEVCKRQQAGEGWFPTVSDVPKRAISMSVRQILKSKELVVVVPDARKAQAVKASLEGEISPMVPGSILRTHPNVTIYLDESSAALLTRGR